MRAVGPLAVVLLIAPILGAEPAAARGGTITFETTDAKAPETMAIASEAFPKGGAIPLKYSSYDDNVSPPLNWTGIPTETKSFALIVEDPDAPPAEPIVHWVAWNMPPTLTTLPEHLNGRTGFPLGDMRQGQNSHGEIGYYGPHPPDGDPAHRYFFQVYALDQNLDLPQGTPLKAVRSAMKGHLLARGEMFGTFARPDHPKHP